MIASEMKKLHNTHVFRKRASVEDQRAQTYDRFSHERQIAHMIFEHFRAIGACEAAHGLSQICSVHVCRMRRPQFDVRWDQGSSSASDTPSDVILEGLYVQLQTVLTLYDQETVRGKSRQAFAHHAHTGRVQVCSCALVLHSVSLYFETARSPRVPQQRSGLRGERWESLPPIPQHTFPMRPVPQPGTPQPPTTSADNCTTVVDTPTTRPLWHNMGHLFLWWCAVLAHHGTLALLGTPQPCALMAHHGPLAPLLETPPNLAPSWRTMDNLSHCRQHEFRLSSRFKGPTPHPRLPSSRPVNADSFCTWPPQGILPTRFGTIGDRTNTLYRSYWYGACPSHYLHTRQTSPSSLARPSTYPSQPAPGHSLGSVR